MYIFLFYYTFLVNNVSLISDQNLLQNINVSIASVNYSITTSNYYNFQTTFTNQTLANLQGNGLWCAIDSYNGSPKYSNVLSTNSTIWVIYITTGLSALRNLSFS